MWSFRDVTERTRLEARSAHQAFHDGLTGSGQQGTSQRSTESHGGPINCAFQLAVLFLDVNNFKTVNDSLAPAICSWALSPRPWSTACDKSDTVARLGGTEFAVLIEDLGDHSEAIRVAEDILTALRRPVSLGSRVCRHREHRIRFGNSGSTSEELLRDADLAMYMAKENGKDRYEEFRTACTQPSWSASSSRRTFVKVSPDR